MSDRLGTALRILRCVADRTDPVAPVGVGVLAELTGTSTSSASRTAAALADTGLLDRAESYGTYRIGRRAVALSGAAAAPWAIAVDFALTRAAALTRETVCLVAPAPGGARVVAMVGSSWTLHMSARIGQVFDDPATAVVRALQSPAPLARGPAAEAGQVLVSEVAEIGQLAVPVLAPGGSCVAALVVCYPGSRAERVGPMARRAVLAARRHLELQLGRASPAPGIGAAASGGLPTGGSTLALAAAVLEQLCVRGAGDRTALASWSGVRPDRMARVLSAAAEAGLVQLDDDDTARPSWAVHGWHHAVTESVLGPRVAPLIAAASRQAATTTYLTVRRGLRSVTVAEAIGDGPLSTGSWLGRPAQIVGSDGGALLVMDLDDEQIAAVLPARTVVTARRTPRDLPSFLLAVRAARQQDLLVIEDFGEDGLTSVAAPVRAASGRVVAAVCLVGPSERIGSTLAPTSATAARLAAELSRLLVAPGR